MTQSERDRHIASAVERWFNKHGADFPWRHHRDPYLVWVAAVMLQQTQLTTVMTYFDRFIAGFPNVTSLADSPIDTVLKTWEGLGYYTRARNLQTAAGIIVNEYGGRIPDTIQQLKSLPGIGDYTAATIASVAFRQPVPVLDSVTIRMNLRLDNSRLDPRSSRTHRALYNRAESRIKKANDPGDFNLGSMELASSACRAGSPQCSRCPLNDFCRAFAMGCPERIPAKRRRAATPHYHIAAGLIWRDGRLLITKRPQHKMLGGLWEFPGGKQEPGETLEQCLKREIHEELGVDIDVSDLFVSVNHAYSHFSITLHTFHCQLIDGEPEALGVDDIEWVVPGDLNGYAFPRADIKIIERLTEIP